jgi:HAD superfamily hydrolase (TIGR01509 family)
MKIAVCGASGLVGKELCKLLEKENIPYVGTYNSNKNFENKNNFYKVNFGDEREVEKFLLETKVTAVCFLVVQRLVDVCEENWNEIKKINIDYVNVTSYVCSKLGIKFIHLSTDYVFDGSLPPYFPDNEKNPLQNYGISKLISEFKVKKNCNNYCIIRTPVLYCSTNNILDNAVTMLGKKVMDKTRAAKEDNYSLRRPLYVPDLCKFILHSAANNLSGTYHFFNPHHKFTKFEMCNKIGQFLEKDTSHITPDDNKISGLASRPYDTQLKDSKIDTNNFMYTTFDETVSECFGKFKHSKINKKLGTGDIFFLFDLDGTILKTDKLHYDSYKYAFQKLDKDFVSYETFLKKINENRLKDFLFEIYSLNNSKYAALKEHKENFISNINAIEFIPGAEDLLNIIKDNNLNYCIVTNTTKTTVKLFKDKNKIFSLFENIITGDDVMSKKPNPECYKLAISKFYKNEKHIVGFENTIAGMEALKHITSKTYYVLCDENESLYKDFIKEDSYIINNFNQL